MVTQPVVDALSLGGIYDAMPLHVAGLLVVFTDGIFTRG
jgi:hypothetical protein